MILSDRQLYIGYDLDNAYSQISYYMMGMKGPTSVSTIVGGDNFLIPTVMYRKSNGQWIYGDEAKAYKDNKDGVYIEDILDHCLKGDSFEIDGEPVTFYSCLEIFVKKTLNLVNIARTTTEERRKIVFTTKSLDSDMVNLLEKLSASVTQERDTVIYQSHKDSIFHYILFQKKELWNRDVLLFDYGPEDFIYYRLRTNRQSVPNIVYIEEHHVPHMVGLPEDKRDAAFTKVVEERVGSGELVSCIYLTGVEYNNRWMDNSLKVVCRNRRAFIGQNLFAEGACYKAISSEEDRHDYMYLGEAKMQVNVGLMANEAGEERYISLIEAGGNWYDTQAGCDIILNNTDSVELIIDSISGDMQTRRTFELSGLPNRPPKTTRIRLTLKPQAVDKIKVTMEDMGFGEIFRRSGKIWNFLMEY
ncbi:MAG: hypothetical protein E7241_10940 [Lachnospiraceae bacterium]|nr:hypothetical protein [Lachnospiraceae bacterium]